jgi:NADH dehydrogenase (ubiquinone) 1 alpha subcomplex subunit 12
MVSLLRTLRSIRRVGLREWWRQMQYIGDAKSGRFVGRDQYVFPLAHLPGLCRTLGRFGNRYYENLNPREEIPGRHRWVDYAQVSSSLRTHIHGSHPSSQHEYNASQVPPEWHSWIHHIRKDPPAEDALMQNLSPTWKTVRPHPPPQCACGVGC